MYKIEQKKQFFFIFGYSSKLVNISYGEFGDMYEYQNKSWKGY